MFQHSLALLLVQTQRDRPLPGRQSVLPMPLSLHSKLFINRIFQRLDENSFMNHFGPGTVLRGAIFLTKTGIGKDCSQ